MSSEWKVEMLCLKTEEYGCHRASGMQFVGIIYHLWEVIWFPNVCIIYKWWLPCTLEMPFLWVCFETHFLLNRQRNALQWVDWAISFLGRNFQRFKRIWDGSRKTSELECFLFKVWTQWENSKIHKKDFGTLDLLFQVRSEKCSNWSQVVPFPFYTENFGGKGDG